MIALIEENVNKITHEVVPLPAGKLLRPRLLLRFAEGYPLASDALIRVGTALELVHVASLLQDDANDGQEKRRGAVISTALPRHAFYASNYLVAKAMELIVDFPELFSPFARVIQDMNRGELLHAALSEDQNFSVRENYRATSLKTARLFAFSAELPALLSGRTDRVARFYGRRFGVHYQYEDDRNDWQEDFRAGRVSLFSSLLNRRTRGCVARVFAAQDLSGYRELVEKHAARIRVGGDG